MEINIEFYSAKSSPLDVMNQIADLLRKLKKKKAVSEWFMHIKTGGRKKGEPARHRHSSKRS